MTEEKIAFWFFQAVFILVTINLWFVAYMFYRSKNGSLRRYLILLFIALGFGSAMRVVTPFLENYLWETTIKALAGIPVLVAGSIVCDHLRRKYLMGRR